MEPDSTEIVEEKPVKPVGRKRVWFFLALGGGVLIGAIVLLTIAFRFRSDSSIPALSPDDLEQQKYDAQRTESEKNKEARLRNEPFVMRKEDAEAAAQLNSLVKGLQLEEATRPTAQNESQLRAEEEAIAAVMRDPRPAASSSALGHEPRYARASASGEPSESRSSSQPMFVYSRTFGGAKYVDAPRKDSATPSTPQRAERTATSSKPSVSTSPGKTTKPPAEKTELIYTEHSPVTLYEGEIIDAVLVNRIVADTEPSPVVCQISKDVYDNSGQYVLFPANCRVVGTSQVVSYKGAHRLFISFHRIVLPNDLSVDLPSSQKALKAMDETGALGLVSKVDRHWFLQFGTAIFFGVLDGLAAAAQRNTEFFSASSVIIDRTSRNFDRILDRIMAEYSSIVPTITVNQGKKVRIYLSDDIVISPFARISERSYYANR
jgi:type IV secretory pathway VirB10-like protein